MALRQGRSDWGAMAMIGLNLHSHDLRVPVGSVPRLKLSLPQCDLPTWRIELHVRSKFKRVS